MQAVKGKVFLTQTQIDQIEDMIILSIWAKKNDSIGQKPEESFFLKKESAATYSPTKSPWQYHRR